VRDAGALEAGDVAGDDPDQRAAVVGGEQRDLVTLMCSSEGW
jgi:hypothetical protein